MNGKDNTGKQQPAKCISHDLTGARTQETVRREVTRNEVSKPIQINIIIPFITSCKRQREDSVKFYVQFSYTPVQKKTVISLKRNKASVSMRFTKISHFKETNFSIKFEVMKKGETGKWEEFSESR